MAAPIRIAIVGMGKIAHDQHLPSIAGDDRFELVATVSSRGEGVGELPHYRTLDELLASDIAVDAVSLCTPPQVRYDLASAAIAAGKHVFLEKPPGATLAEVAMLEAQAAEAGVTLFASWHSRYAAGVAPARAWLADRRILSAAIVWREDVRVWHPGQDWIWAPGGLGVFDPGINALSVLTRILPAPLLLQAAELGFPANKDAPIAADLEYVSAGAPVAVAFDFDQRGPQTWDIVVEAEDGELKLSMGASELAIDGVAVDLGDDPEYARLYRRFAELLERRESDADLAPFRHVADAFLLGRRKELQPFDWNG